ncbi:unannotated protein [freshwater metagenome]|uniref:Unannotated protein n=1 Tax=freshwater metagenome TaxID=449393 RepID=A0A6J7FLD3_9ZZZZ|nr:helix-turn-helix domain-containing protein [Actinomycetota bacterium]
MSETDQIERVGARLRALRMDRGATQEVAARAIGCSVSTLRRLEAGAVPQAKTAKAVGSFYGCRPSAIWAEDVLVDLQLETDDKNTPAPLVAAGGTTESHVTAPDDTQL